MKTMGLLLPMWGVHSLAFAQEVPEFKVAQGGLNSPLFQLFINLSLILLLIFVLAWLYKKLNGLTGLSVKNQPMKVVSSLNLGFREKLVLVQVGKQYLVLGINAQKMECLSKIDDLPDDMLADEAETGRSFKDNLQAMLQKGKS